jgi:threonylcarbamoyladenosine tRNA methylthiotransferase MtaB
LNQYEGFCLIEKFAYIEDLVVVNTCCVTKEAAVKSLKKFKQAIKKHPNSTIIATGCACRLYPKKFSAAYRVIDNVQRIDLIQNVLPRPEKSRYFLKIEDGCNGDCTFCIVAKVRDTIKSKPLDDIKKEIEWAQSLGYKEIVLVGANIGLYGIDKGLHLLDVLKMLGTITDLPRIRLSSIEPRFINRELIDHLKAIPLCRHFHFPIQSADNYILSRMRRGYDVSHLDNVITMISKNFTDVAIGADIIVGFPGEEEKHFLNTYHFVESTPFTHLHVFPYSPRPFTEAYTLGDPIQTGLKKERLWQLKDLVAQKNYKFRRNLLNKTFDIIIEDNNGALQGLTDNYIRVIVDHECTKNELVKVQIVDVQKGSTYGCVVM